MMERWNSLTEREQGLVAVAGILTALVAIYLGIVRPVGTYEAESARALAAARLTYNEVASGADVLKLARAAGAREKGDDRPIRVLVADTARAAGVSISRIQPGEDGGLTVWVESVASPGLYAWLKAMADTQDVAPEKIFIQKSGTGGLLRVQLQFGGQA